MLESLHVHNFALIEDAKVEFSSGFNVFTGETGAGKSILIDAFGIVLGDRANTDFIRSGTDGFWVQAVFDIDGNIEISKFLSEQGIECDEELFLKRIVDVQGKSKASINGVQVPVGILREIGSLLVNIHGQHENQLLLKQGIALELTDEFGGSVIAAIKQKYQKLYADYTNAQSDLKKLESMNDDYDHLLKLYQYTLDEINSANLRLGEEEELKEEANILQHGERIISSVGAAHCFLENDDGILNNLAKARDEIREVIKYDKSLETVYKSLDESWINLDDARGELANYIGNNPFSEERVSEVQSRLDIIYKLEKKYGGTIENILIKAQETKLMIERMEEINDTIEAAKKHLKEVTVEIEKIAIILTEERKKIAAKFVKQVIGHIKDLAMPDCKLEIKFSDLSEFTESGRDELIFLFSANKGEPLQEFAKVASGGELSRVALALKTVLLSTQDVGSMVFDEIDTGVGGVTAERMGEKMAILAGTSQVLCITHLPQIAAFADRHIFIEKQTHEDRTITTLNVLLKQGRVDELVRMTVGSNQTKAATQAAEELLSNARIFKEKNVGRK